MSLLSRFSPRAPLPGFLAVILTTLPSCSKESEAKALPRPGPAARIVSLAPSITESIAFLGLADRLVAVTRFCDYPPEVRSLPKIGGYIDPSLEAIFRVEPDLVLGLGEHKETLAKLRGGGLRCLSLDERDLEGIFESLLRIGTLCGKGQQARKKVETLRSTLRTTRARVRGRRTPTVLVSVGRHAGQGTLGKVYAAGPNTFLGQLVEIAGGKNLASGMRAPFPPLSTEGLLRLDPEVIFDIVPGLEENGGTEGLVLSDWKKLPGLRAVKKGRVHVLAANWAVRPGPRFPKILDAFLRGLHPELVRPKEKR